MMKPVVVLIAVACAAMLIGCAATMKPNPEFRDCANACTKRQDACMVSASTAADIAKCNAALDACVSSCERKFPRYVQP